MHDALYVSMCVWCVAWTVSGAMLDSQHSTTSHRRGSTQSDTSALVSSLTHDLSQSPTTANTRDLSPSPSPSCSSLHLRSEGSPNSTPGTPGKADQYFCCEQEAADYSPRTVTQIGTQTSPESAASGIKGHFNIGASGNKEERLSPKQNRKDRSSVSSKSRSKRAMSPASMATGRERSLTLSKEPIKSAISPSVAESLRAMFAAFLWHEGVVHDAMACASFLKFHPSLPKQGALVVTRQHGSAADAGDEKAKSELTKEQRARQRHSVEVSTAGNYLHIQPSTLETLTRSAANASANRNRAKKQHSEGVIKEESGEGSSKLTSLPETVAILPPALKSLVVLWEELSRSCLQAIIQNMVLLPSPTVSARTVKKVDKPSTGKVLASESKDFKPEKEGNSKKSGHKKKEWKPMGRVNILGEVAGSAMLGPGPSGSVERETLCELCGNMYPQPVTYHMRQAHPGCGGHAGGKGYNSGGNFCVGWAGNCGDGGVGGSSWYLVCDSCRAKYLRCRIHNKDKSGGRKNGVSRRKAGVLSSNCSSKMQSPTASSAARETHIIMKNNAMFLLELASAAGSGLPTNQQRRSFISSMPSVSENYSPPEPSGPFSPVGPFQCLQALGVYPSQQMRDDQTFLEEAFRRENGGSQMSSVGNMSSSRPTSDNLSDNESESSKARTFHRSISMGTNGVPWSRRDGEGRYIMMRRRNNSSGEMASGECCCVNL
ncbi:hypothetical protein PR048_031800 [Dryococelus australis]|uniref:Uncharacterized protein n=1 Tax=Dryococelus australis TaxID=614101 RepID=A0ABQ9GAC7_9NEOP|nr:hypothetical protein PR048_031800 [Dryococelus australis]